MDDSRVDMSEELNLNIIEEALATFQGDPFVFFEEVWGLTPQPIKQRYVPMLEHLLTTPAKYFNLEVTLFSDEMFGEFKNGKHLTWQQTLLLIAVKRAINDSPQTPFPRQISVCSGKGTGKTETVSGLILWFLFSFPSSIVMATAPTGDQLFSVLWSSLSGGIQRMKEFYRTQYVWQNKFIRMAANLTGKWFARAKTSGPGEHGALSGLHCFENETVEVMTKDGFKDFKDITTKDKVMTRIGWQKPSKVIREQYHGEMVFQEGTLFSFSVTPHHKFPVQIRNGHYLRDNVEQWSKEKLVTVEDWGRYLVKIPRHIKKDWGKEQEVYRIPVYKNHYKSQPQRKSFNLPMDTWVAFLGWYLSEGSVYKRKIDIAQTLVNQEKRDEIAEIITALGFNPSVGKNSICLGNAQLAEHIRKICPGKSLTKRVPSFIFDLSRRQILIFLDAYRKGDGYSESGTGRVGYVTASKGMADDLQKLIILTGGYATTFTTHLKGSTMSVGNRNGVRNSDCYSVREWKGERNRFAVSKGMQRKRKTYKGIVECLTVPSSMFYVRDKKTSHTFWTGNSAHMFAVVDEAASVEEGVIDEARYTMTNDNNLIILISNAHTATSFFKSTFDEGSGWINIIFNAEESPIVSGSTIAKVLQDCGGDREHDKYRVHVRGLFPKAGLLDDAEGWRRMYDDKWINAFFAASAKDARLNSPYLGVDVGGEGSDSSEIYGRDAILAQHIYSEGTSTPETIAKLTIKAIENLEADGRDVSIDNFGTGADVSAKIALLSERELFCRGVNVGMKCEDPDDRRAYFNERARLSDMLLKWGIQGGRCVPDEKLQKELEGIYCKEGDGGKLQIMPKKKMRALGLKSPNHFDALALTFAQDTAFAMRVPRGDHLYYPDRPEVDKEKESVNPQNRHRMISLV